MSFPSRGALLERVIDKLPESLLALLALSFALGVRHGFDPDHLAAIDGIARTNAIARPRLARRSGALFSLGHGLVVMLIALCANNLLDRWEPSPLLQSVGTTISVVFLLVLSAATLHGMWKSVPDEEVMTQGLRARLLLRALSVRHAGSVLGAGALFAVSFDTVSLGLLFGVSAAGSGNTLHAALPALSFAAGMIATDGLNGLLVARLAARAGRRAGLASRIMAASIAGSGILVALLIVARALSRSMDSWAEPRWLLVGAVAMTLPVAGFVVATLAARALRPGGTTLS